MGKTKIVLDLQSDLILNNALIVRPSGIVKSDLPGLVEDINGLTMSIADEASARAAADQQLSNDLSDLQNYVDTTVDSAIATLTSDLADETAARIADVDAEETRALAAEAQLSNDLADLQTYVDTTVDSAIATLTSDLADETAARIADVDAEETRAIAAEGVLQSNIDVEKGRIDAILDGSTINLDQFREVVEFVEGIDLANDNSLISAVNDINASIDAEETRALAAEASLQAAIDAEAAARISADADLDGRIVDIISNTNAPIIDSFSEVVAQMEAMPGVDESSIVVDSENNISLKDTVSAPTSGVRTFEGLVNVGSEPSLDANFVDLSLVTKGYVTGVADGISTNLNNLQTYVNTTVDSAIATLTTDIDNEEAARIAGDEQLQANIDAINTDISGAVNNESSARIAGDAQLQSDIDALALTDGETIDLNYADNTIRLKEVVAAPDSGVRTFEGDIKVGQQPDTLPSYNDSSLITKGILDARVSSEVSTINTSISDEVSRAQNAESQLQANIDTERNRIDAILDASEADKDNFAEIVQLINSVDTTNDEAFASYVISNNERLTIEEQERLRLTDLLGGGIINEQIAREDGDAALQHEFDILPMTDGETIELNYTDNTIRLKEFVNMPDSGVRVFEGDLKADSQPENRGTFNELSYVTKNYVDNKVTNDLSDAVEQEMAERIAADAALTELIDVKKSEAITSSNEYTDVERLRALAAEGSLQSSIDAFALTDGDTIDVNYADNTIRLKEVVSAPDSGVRTFEGDVKVGEQPSSLSSYNDFSLITKGIMDTRLSEEVGSINTSISDEVSRAQDAEAQLQLNIDTERERIDAILLASDADKDNFAEIVSLINSVDTENDQAFASYVLSNDAALAAEVAERLRLTSLLGDGVVNEQIAREDADAAIHNELNNLPMTDGETIDVNYADNTIKLKDIVAAPTSGYRVFEGDLKLNAQPETDPNFNDLSLITKYYVDNKVSTDLTIAIEQEEADRIAADAGLMADLNSEIQRAQAVEASLLASIDAEVLARLAADADLDSRIVDIVSNSNAPIIDSFTEVVSSLNELRSDLTIETDDRIAADTQLSSDLADETAARIADVDAEEARATAAESVLSARIDINEADIVEVSTNLSNAIGSETNRAMLAEDALSATFSAALSAEVADRVADVDAEEARATAAELVLTNNLSTEEAARIAGDAALSATFSAALSAETFRAQAAEVQLSNDLSDETAARISVDTVLQSNIDVEKGRIDAILLASDADKDSFAEIVSLINSVDTENDQAFASYVLSNNAALSSLSATFSAALSAEEAARIADVDAEEVRALAAEAALSSDLADLQTYVDTTVDSAIATLTSDLADETAARIADVDTEEARALAAEAGITADLVTETNRATTAETLLQSNIDVEKGRIDAILLASDADKDNFAEIVTLINSVDTENDQAFASYVLSNNAALSSLSTTFSSALSAEEVARIAGDAQLSSDLADLQSYVDTTVDSAIATLTSDLADETAARIADVDAEEARALAAESALSATFSAALSAEITRATFAELTLSNDLSDETAARISVDTLLQSNIDVEKGRIDAILLASDADKDSFAEIVTLINSVDTENDQAFASYVLSNNAALSSLSATFSAALSAEEAARIADVDAEEARALAAEAALSSDLADLQTYVDTTVDSAIATLTSDLADETAARIADVDAEETRALAAEAVLQTNINTEANERMAEDITLQGNIDIEASRAQIAETAIATDLATEIADRIAAVSSEETRAMLAESALSATFSAAISSEETRAIAAEGVLQSNIDVEKGRIDSILLASDADKDSFAEIVQLINSVDTTNDQAFASYVLSNDAALASEVSRATAAESALSATFSAAISSEVSRATAAELVLTNDLATEVSRATAAESALTSALSAEEASRIAGDSALQSSLNNEIADRIAAGQAAQTALDSETTRAMAAEATLTSDLATEVSRATAAESALSATFSAALSAESARAIAAEGVLTSDLSSEVSRALAAESSLSATFSAALSAETFRAQTAEVQLQNELSDETSYRIDADTLLQSNIDVEKGRIDAILLASDADKDSFAEIVSLINSVDTTNDTAFASYVLSNDAALASEVSRATAAESALSATFSAAISAEVSARIADVDAEETRALAAEAALATDFANIYCKKVSVSGTPNGVLTSFSLTSPVRLGSEMIYLNGLLMEEGEDYTTVLTSGKVTSVTFSSAPTSSMKVVAYGVY